MPARKFLSENMALTLGVALPVLLVVFFVLAAWLPGLYVAPPEYGFVFSTGNNHSASSVRFAVTEGKFHAYSIKPKSDERTGLPYYYSVPKLYHFDAAQRSVREIPLNIPAASAYPSPEAELEINVPELESATLDTRTKSPDGYTVNVNPRDYYGPGLIFWGARGTREGSISKSGYAVPVPEMVPYNTNFIGWMVETP